MLWRILLEGLRFGIPGNQFNIGDSIGEGEVADNTIDEAHHETVWSTGYNGEGRIYSFNERFENNAPDDYYENNSSRDGIFNHTESGAVMAVFVSQAQGVIAAA